MEVSTSIQTRFSHETGGARADTMFYFSVDGSGFSGDMLGHGVTRKSIGHSVAVGDLGSISRLSVDVSGESGLESGASRV